MTERFPLGEGSIAYDLMGEGPLIVLAHGMGDSRHSYRFVAPQLAEAGYRVATMDIRGCGESTATWDSYSRTAIAGDIVALVRHLGGPAVVVGHSISGGAATIAAADAPDVVVGVAELGSFTRKQTPDLAGLFRNRRYRTAMLHLAKVMMLGSIKSWVAYLDLAIPAPPSDWDRERSRIRSVVSRPERRAALQAMARTAPADAGARLKDVQCPVLIVQGSADPDWADPVREGHGIISELPEGIGELAVIPDTGHYVHVEAPEQLLDILAPFLQGTLPRTGPAARA
jgi:pimeloyl-ACP methyl ester carboxylesterase